MGRDMVYLNAPYLNALYLNDCALLCALGDERATIRNRLLVDGTSGLTL